MTTTDIRKKISGIEGVGGHKLVKMIGGGGGVKIYGRKIDENKVFDCKQYQRNEHNIDAYMY